MGFYVLEEQVVLHRTDDSNTISIITLHWYIGTKKLKYTFHFKHEMLQNILMM